MIELGIGMTLQNQILEEMRGWNISSEINIKVVELDGVVEKKSLFV